MSNCGENLFFKFLFGFLVFRERDWGENKTREGRIPNAILCKQSIANNSSRY